MKAWNERKENTEKEEGKKEIGKELSEGERMQKKQEKKCGRETEGIKEMQEI